MSVNKALGHGVDLWTGRRGDGGATPAQQVHDGLMRWLMSPPVLRPVFALLRRLPNVSAGTRTLVTRHAEVVEVLRRDEDFGIDPAFGERMEQANGPFLLGMSRSQTYEGEAGLLREVIRADDLPRIRGFVADSAAELVNAARPLGRIDAVDGLARVVMMRLVASYLGVPGPDEQTLQRWTRDLFAYLFHQRSAQAGVAAGAALRGYLESLIRERRAALDSGEPPTDDVLTRLLVLERKGDHRVNGDVVRRNLAGLAIPMAEEIARAAVYAIDELLRRPAARDRARQAALAGDRDAVTHYAFEAMRFQPNGPVVLPRYCTRGTTLAAGTRWERRIPKGQRLLVATISGMFDDQAFPQPDRFRPDRLLEGYLHFGHGMHTCFGRAIATVAVPELVAALLRLPDLRRAPGPAGRIAYEGLLPTHLILEFKQ